MPGNTSNGEPCWELALMAGERLGQLRQGDLDFTPNDRVGGLLEQQLGVERGVQPEKAQMRLGGLSSQLAAQLERQAQRGVHGHRNRDQARLAGVLGAQGLDGSVHRGDAEAGGLQVGPGRGDVQGLSTELVAADEQHRAGLTPG